LKAAYMLVLCEKLSVARDFAEALGCGGKRGYYQNDKVTITYCVGHLFELAKPECYDPSYKTWDVTKLPIIPETFRYKSIPDIASQTDVVLSLLRNYAHDDMVVATDAGREGELIARIVFKEAGITDISRVRRFWVSEALTKEVIRKGLETAKPWLDYNRIALEGVVRQQADWLIGINLTRYMTCGNNTLFSVGRVQTALLNAIAVRNSEVARFTPVPFSELEAEIQSSNGAVIKVWLVHPKTGKTAFFDNSEYLHTAQAACRGKAVDQVQATAAKEVRKPEKLLNITGLQKKAFKLYGYTPEKTLEIAQALYEKHKCLSYPRTPSRVMGDQNVDLFREKFRLLLARYPGYAQHCDESLITPGNRNIFNSTALEDHHALIPLAPLPDNASAQEKNVFEIVLRSFFIVCMPDYIYNKKHLVFHIGEYAFKSAINEVIQKGFKAALKEEAEGDKEEQEVGQFYEKSCAILKLEILHKKTSPQKEFSQDTLLAFMENPRNKEEAKLIGLGTPATRSAIIKNLFDRGYIREDKKKIYAAGKGLFLLKQLQKDEKLGRIADVGETSAWERQLQENPGEFKKSIIEYLRSCIKQGDREHYVEDDLGRCPFCGNPMREAQKNYYCTGYKQVPPCMLSIWKEVAGARVSTADIKLLVSGKPTGIKKCTSKNGKRFSANFVLEKDGKLAFRFPEDKPRYPPKARTGKEQ
jgi:DNA topoisomerase-3